MKKNYLVLGIILISLIILGCKQQVDNISEPTGSIPAQPPISPPISDDLEASTDQVSILGKGGFDPAEAIIKQGDKLVWLNDDPQKKSVVLNFKKGTKPIWSKVVVSPLLKAGDTYERTFDEAGTYEYWTTGYGVIGKIIVTE